MIGQFARQEGIDGWRQDAIAAGAALVAGRGLPSSFAVWALISLGVRELVWVGEPLSETLRFGDFLAREHAPGLGAEIRDYPLEPRSLDELGWIISSIGNTRVMIGCANERLASVARAQSEALRIPFLSLACVRDGFQTGAPGDRAPEHPAAAMIAAALAVDEFRQMVNPISHLADREFGAVEIESVMPVRPGAVALVGVGGIGVYCALLLTMAGAPLVLVDADTVDITNLNRQGLFTSGDAAHNRPKAVAAAERLLDLFPGASVRGCDARIDRGSENLLRSFAPEVIVSAVDNAATRLILSEMGARIEVPVVQAGTDVFSADCFVQEIGRPALDQQMRGALSTAARAEQARTGHGCAADPSYVVPGMMAGAFAAGRALSLLGGARALPSLHWRSGSLPRARQEIRDEFALPSF